MSLLIVNAATACAEQVNHAVSLLQSSIRDCRVIDVSSMRVESCKGCYVCMFVTPGKCCIRDDGEKLFRQILQHEEIIFIFDSALNFIDHKGINLINRMFSLVNITVEPRGGEILHIMRYGTISRIGMLYTGDADEALVNAWLNRVAANYNAVAMGAVSITNVSEVCRWML